MKNLLILTIIFLVASCNSQISNPNVAVNNLEKDSLSTNNTLINQPKSDSSVTGVTSLDKGEFHYQHEFISFENLSSQYGIFITDHEFDSIQGTCYELFYKQEKKIFKTTSINRLKDKLSELPKSSTLNWYDTCTWSRMINLPKENKDKLISICKNLNINLIKPGSEPNSNIVCYCNVY
jgi:hypothetical protein